MSADRTLFKPALDFDLSLDLTSSGMRARVLGSPFGQASIDFAAPPAPPSFEQLTPAAAQEFGRRLFAAAFQGEVLGLLRRSLDEATRQETQLRLLLRLGNAPALAELPWECLYDDAANGFLALLTDTPVIRYIEVPQPNRPLTVTLPLRVLVMISSPDDYPPLDVEKEWASLQNALAAAQLGGLVAIDRLDDATAANLQHQLRQQTYHVFHFIGHGGFDERTQDGLLIFEDESNHGRPLTGQALGALLGSERRSLVLAVLNACEGARTGRGNPFGGVAQSLVRLGIPAVVANQAPIPNQSAAAFAGEFYRSLAEGFPVDAALAEGRKAIYAAGGEIEWTIPALFLRSASDGRIFQPQALDVTKVVSALQESLPAGDPMPRQLVEALQRLQTFHACLYEWKELHNALNDISMVLDQFEREVERLDASGTRGDPRALARLWRPVAQKMEYLLMAWAATIKLIGAPLERRPDGVSGPPWATELQGARERIEALLHPSDFDLTALYDATYDFSDAAQRHMYLADKSFRDTAGELYNLSQLILGSTPHERV